MAVIIVGQVAQLAWVCHRCKRTFGLDGGPSDPRGAIAAQEHEEECKSDVRIGMPLPKIEMVIVPPTGSGPPA